MVILLGLAAAVLYGTGDFLGGLASRRVQVLAVLTLAETAGVPHAAVEAIRTGGTPVFVAHDEALVYRICSEIFRTQRLSDASFNETVAALGEQGLVEVIAIVGYYTLIGNTLNVFQVALPEGEPLPFPE